MSFARAFSTRVRKQQQQPEMEISLPMFIGRAASQRGGKPVVRTQISSPMALTSTTNQQIRNAHAISGTSPIEIRHVSSGSTSSSSDESDASNSSIHSHDTMTDASSVDNSPIGTEPEPNHLSCYFKPGVDTHSRSTSTLTSPTHSTHPSLDTPRLPQRAPSHSKRAHETLHRKRSVQRMLSPPPSRHSEREPTQYRASTEMFSAGPYSPQKQTFVEAPVESNPFGKELAQLDEVAEEFGQVVRSAERDADEVYMEAHGLGKFGALEYQLDLVDLVRECFGVVEVCEEVEDFGGFF